MLKCPKSNSHKTSDMLAWPIINGCIWQIGIAVNIIMRFKCQQINEHKCANMGLIENTKQ